MKGGLACSSEGGTFRYEGGPARDFKNNQDMDEKEAFLKELRGDAQVEGGVFTIDVAAARAKMAKFQLPEREMFVLKFVQAASQAADALIIERGGGFLRFRFRGWPKELNLEVLGQRFCSIFEHSFEDAAGCITVALNSILADPEAVVTAEFFARGEAQGQSLRLQENWDLDKCEVRDFSDSVVGSLVFEIPLAGIDGLEVERLLKERCAYARVAIEFNGVNLSVYAEPPNTSGKHLGEYFRENRWMGESVISESPHYQVPRLREEPLIRLTYPGSEPEKDVPGSWLLLGLDAAPSTPVHLVKSGVVVDRKMRDLGFPGLIMVMDAGDLESDLTGLQIREDKRLEESLQYLKPAILDLHERCLAALSVLESEKQDTDANAPMHSASTAASLGTLAACLSSFLWAGGKLAWVLLGGFWFWPPVVAVFTGWFLGYGRTDESDRQARAEVRARLERVLAKHPKSRYSGGRR